MAATTQAKGEAPANHKTPPVFKARLHALQLAVWGNEHVTEDGEVRTFHTINIERNYRDANDEWHKTSQLRASDLGDAIALLQRSQQFLTTVG